MFRKELDVYASISLVKNIPGKWACRHQNVDFAIIRENTEGEYSGLEHSVFYYILILACSWSSRVIESCYKIQNRENRSLCF